MGNAANVFLYVLGIVVFGIMYWLIGGILGIIIDTGVADTTTYSCWDIMWYVWCGLVIVYLVFGGIWLIKSYKLSPGGM